MITFDHGITKEFLKKHSFILAQGIYQMAYPYFM
jgi:hypothetical protein